MTTALKQYVNNTVQTLSTQDLHLNYICVFDFVIGPFRLLLKYYASISVDICSHRCVKYNLPNIPDFETLFVQTQEFIISCNGEHVRYATDSYADLCHKFTRNLVERKQPLRGICILVTAINKIQLEELMTPIFSMNKSIVSQSPSPTLQAFPW